MKACIKLCKSLNKTYSNFVLAIVIVSSFYYVALVSKIQLYKDREIIQISVVLCGLLRP